MSYKYFTLDEFKCSETGDNHINPTFVTRLDILREHCGFPFVVNSGYRSPEHSVEKAKPRPGFHTQGIAADIRVDNGEHYYKIVKEAMAMGFRGIGIAQGFVHLDMRDGLPVIWVY